MERICYCSKILPGKSEEVIEHWNEKIVKKEGQFTKDEIEFRKNAGVSCFESWLQKTPEGDFKIHYLEGPSCEQIFSKLRGLIATKNHVALDLQRFYLNVLGKDYALSSVEPKVESLFSLSLPKTFPHVLRKGFVFPLRPEKEGEHRKFRKEAMNEKKARHEASMKAFGVNHLDVWLQTLGDRKYLVVYTERSPEGLKDTPERLREISNEWKELSDTLIDHTGLAYGDLNPEVRLLTGKL